MMSMAELKITYDNCIKVQSDVISRKRIKLNKAEKSRDYEEARRLRGILNILYDEKNELESLARSLEEYCA